MQNPFAAYTTLEAARALNVQPNTLRVAVHRAGHYQNITPTKLPQHAGRLLWPRDEVLKLAGQHVAGRKVTIDLRTTNPWIETLGLSPADPMAEAIAIGLNDPRDDDSHPAAVRLDEWHAVRSWVEAASKRLEAARSRMAPEQWADALTLQARAVAGVVAGLPPETLQAAIALVIGGAA